MIAPRSFEVPCRIAIEQSEAHFHAHVELGEDIAIRAGDRVRVHGEPIAIRFGESATYERTATVTRASPLVRGWTKLVAYLDLAELYEVSFNPGAMR